MVSGQVMMAILIAQNKKPHHQGANKSGEYGQHIKDSTT
jgi:hypothetical protein